MRKYIMLFCTLNYFGISVWQLYDAYAPKVGPIGNGPNETYIWGKFALSMIGSLAFFVLTINMFRKERKDQTQKKEE